MRTTEMEDPQLQALKREKSLKLENWKNHKGKRKVFEERKNKDLSNQACMSELGAQELPESEGQELTAEQWAERYEEPVGRPRGENEGAKHRENAG